MSQVTAVSPLTSHSPDLGSTRDPARPSTAPSGDAAPFSFSGDPPPVDLSVVVLLVRGYIVKATRCSERGRPLNEGNHIALCEQFWPWNGAGDSVWGRDWGSNGRLGVVGGHRRGLWGRLGRRTRRTRLEALGEEHSRDASPPDGDAASNVRLLTFQRPPRATLQGRLSTPGSPSTCPPSTGASVQQEALTLDVRECFCHPHPAGCPEE